MPALYEPMNPDETVTARKKALSDFTDIAQPAKATSQKYERDKLIMDAMNEAGNKPKMAQGQTGDPSTAMRGLGTLGVIQGATSAGAKLLPQQGAQQDALNYQGAQLQQSIANSRTGQAVKNTVSGMENETQRLARMVAQRAFDAGYESKQTIFSANASLADYSFEALKGDFAAGRVSQKEIRDLNATFSKDAALKKQKADQAYDKAKMEFEADMAAGNTERAKSRILAFNQAAKEALEAAAKAQATASIISGATDILGGIVSVISPAAGAVVKGVGTMIGGSK